MPETTPPNVLFIISDQHHPRFMGCAGHPRVETPHLDRLAGRGTRFSRAYCNFPLCGPSRMALMSGRYPSEIDCMTNHAPLRSDVPTFAHGFNQGGYETLLCGRMHFSGPDQRHGFHRRIISDVGGNPNLPTSAQIRPLLGPLSNTTGPHARSIVKSGPGASGYLAYDAATSDAAIHFLHQQGQAPDDAAPFMMTVGYIQPHAPFVAPAEDYARYDEQIGEDDLPAVDYERLHPANRRLPQRAGLEDEDAAPSAADQRRARVAYHGMCRYLDRQVGRVLDALDASGQAENTIVVYSSDHGEQLGEHGLWWKHTFYEGSLGIPLIMAGPGVPEGRTINQNVGLMNVPPTLLDLCGAPPIPGASVGSFRCLLEGDASAWADEVIAEHVIMDHPQGLDRMVKRGPWKLNTYFGYDEPELFNVEDDPREMHDLAADPASRQIRQALLARATEGWDDARAMDQLFEQQSNQRMIDSALRQTDAPPADALWYDPDNPPENRIDGLV